MIINSLPIQEYRNKEEEIKKMLSKLLIKIREENGIKNSFIVTKELGLSSATLRNIEEGISFPTTRVLNDLIDLYVMTPKEKENVLELKRAMLKVRRMIKSLRKGEGR